MIRFVYGQDSKANQGVIFTIIQSDATSIQLAPKHPPSGFVAGNRTSTGVTPYEPRGVNVDKNDSIYIADTGRTCLSALVLCCSFLHFFLRFPCNAWFSLTPLYLFVS